MTYLAIISATLTAIFIWFCGISYGHWRGYMKGYWQGRYESNLRNYIVEIEDEPEFKDHQLN